MVKKALRRSGHLKPANRIMGGEADLTFDL